MPVMCATIYAKGNVMRNFDAYFANGSQVPYADLIEELENPDKEFTKIFKRAGVLDSVDVRHMKKHWFSDEPPGYWPLHRGKENIMKQATIRALKCAQTDCLPIATSWVCTGSQFQCIVEMCPSQVNLLIATPPPPMLPEEAAVEETIWISGSPEAMEMVRTPYVEDWSGQGIAPPNYQDTTLSHVAELQMKGT